MTMTRRQMLAALPMTAAVAAAGAVPFSVRAETPLSVVATTGMIADTVTRVGGDRVTVTALMGPGVDPHAYRQTRSDIVAMGQADMVLWNGLYLEAQLEDFLTDLSGVTPVRAVAEAVPEARRISHEDYAGRFDPHVWMDPDLWAYVIADIREALSAARPESAEVFAANAEALLAEAEALAAYTDQVLASVPDSARVIVSAHDAFGYFAARYGFETMGIQGLSTESEAGLNRIAELVDLLVTREIGAVFVETSVSDRNMRALIEGAAARGHQVRIGGELFSDAMGEPGTYEGTWLGMIDHNATTIARALGGTAPELGLNGRLG